MNFEDWMVSEGLSQSTVRKYAGAIDGALTEWGKEHASLDQSLRTIHDAQEFAAFSELIEAANVYVERNSRGNHMYGAALRKYARYLEALSSSDSTNVSGVFVKQLAAIAASEAVKPPFRPQDQMDARARVLREVVRRQGQPQFRGKLIQAYDAKCAITRCPLLVVLEAAHITPYFGPATNSVSNGLLLRSDLHPLWDLGLVAINPSNMLLAVRKEVIDPAYRSLAGTQIFLPLLVPLRPAISALKQQWEIFCR